MSFLLRLFYLNITGLENDPERYGLSAARRKKYEACCHDGDRLRSLGASVALGRALHSVGLLERDMAYIENEYGKPAFANHPELHFNLSHSGNYVLCALSDFPVGCDVQEVKPIKHNIPRRFFAPEEAADIAAASAEEREHRFFRYWALKEACVKATGRGLHLPLNAFCLSLTGHSTELAGRRYYLTEIQNIPGYTAAVCAESPDEPVTEGPVQPSNLLLHIE